MTEFSWGVFTPSFVDDLIEWLAGRSVLEVMAGNGRLARILSERGVRLVATTLFASHDGHLDGMLHQVEEMSALAAVDEYGADADILMVSWPVADDGMTRAVRQWSPEKPIVFIGEITQYLPDFTGLGGCASDSFFEATEIVHEFQSYKGRSQLDRAVVLKLRDSQSKISALQQPRAF